MNFDRRLNADIKSGSGSNKITINWSKEVGDYFISAGDLLKDRIVINNAKSADFTVSRDYSYWGLGYVDHDYLIFTNKSTGTAITLAGWGESDETTYGVYFSADKKIVYSKPMESPILDAVRATPDYRG